MSNKKSRRNGLPQLSGYFVEEVTVDPKRAAFFRKNGLTGAVFPIPSAKVKGGGQSTRTPDLTEAALSQ